MSRHSKREEEERDILGELGGWLVYILLIIGLTYLIITFVGQRTMVSGSSMETTLQDGDNLIVDKISYRFRDPKRYDIIGFPVVGLKANVYDGSYHEVDSSEMAFHIAGSLAFKDAMKKASPVLLEPIMRVEVTMPEEYMGDVIGDINSRRGRIEGMDDLGGGKIVRGFVPLSEMFGYSTDLRSRTQGRGNYSMFFDRYEPVPKNVQDKVLANHAK